MAGRTTLSENEIRPKELMDEQARRFANDIARLMRHQADFVAVPCPACDGAETTPAFEKYGMSFVSCVHCETVFANPRPRPEHMEEYYRESENYAYWNQYIFPASVESRREKIFKPRVELVFEICHRYGIPTDTLVEVGPGFGIFCEEVQKTKQFKQVIAIEPTPDLAESCRSKGIKVIEKSVEKVDVSELALNGQLANVIASFEVIEHLFSPGKFIRQCASLLAPGGILIITCPNVKGFDIVVLKEQSIAVDVEHVNLFHPDSLALLMTAAGLEVIEKRTPGKLDAELVRNRMLDSSLDPNTQPFLKQVLIDEWDEKGGAFQEFLSKNNLSSNMMLVARKNSSL